MIMNKAPSPRRGSPLLAILLVVVLSFVFLGIISWLNIDGYKWLFELIVMVAAVFAVYYVLRVKYMDYVYETVGENLIFKQVMGKGERYVFSVELSRIRRFVKEDELESEISRLDVKDMSKYYIDATPLPVIGLVYYDTTCNCEKILTFKPSEQFLEDLSKKTIDKPR